MTFKHRLFSLIASLLPLLTACDLEKDITVALPEHTPQLMVECYLDPGKPLRASVLESNSYFGSPQTEPLSDVQVIIGYNGKKVELNYNPAFVSDQSKFYTHRSREIMQGNPGDVYTIEVTDSKGRKVTGTTTILPKVPLDTVAWRFNSKDEALLLASFQDDGDTRNFYRFMIHRGNLKVDSERDFTTNDNLTNGIQMTLGTGYSFEKGDTLIVSLFHIEEPYYNFINSASDAKNANGNPFAQPSSIKSTVQGGLGVFTNLAYDRKVIIIK